MHFKRPLDLVGDSALNRVVGEYHPLSSSDERVFTLELGAFYSDTLVVRNTATGTILELNKDYALLNTAQGAILESGGKRVDTIVFMLNSDMPAVEVDYQAVGGQYTILSLAVISLLEQNKNAEREPIYFPDILNKPDAIAPTPHTHELHDLSEVEDGVSALTKVLENIYRKDLENYRKTFDYLYGKIGTVSGNINTVLQEIQTEINLLRSKSEYKPGDVIVGDFGQNPVAYYPEVDWLLIPDTFLFGNTLSAGTDPLTIDIAGGTGHLARKTHMYGAVAKGGPRYSVSSNKTAVNEGESFDITIVAENTVPGASVPYLITGVNSSDIDVPLSGHVTLDSSLIAVLTVTAIADETTETDETLRFSLVDAPNAVAQVTIRDTSKSPTYELFYSSDLNGTTRINQTNEGTTIYLQIRSENVPANQQVNMFYGGSINSSDYSGTLPATITMNQNRGTIPITFTNDMTTEGDEVLIAKLSLSTEAQARAISTLTVIDTSRAPVYSMRFTSDLAGNSPIIQVNEGVTFYALIETQNVANGTVMTLQYGGTATAEDFDGTRPATVTINGNRGVVTLATKADLTTEGDELFTVTAFINGSVKTQGTIVILDTSYNPSMSLRYSSNSTGTNTITSVNEGDTFYLIVATDATVPNGTVYQINYEGTATPADFVGTRPNTVTIVSQRGVVEYKVANDFSTEGDEVMRVRLINMSNNVEMGTAAITIVDTSKAAGYEVFYSRASTSDTAITSVNEGEDIFLVVKTSNVANGTVLNIEQYIGGRLAITANGDVSSNPPTTVTISNNRGFALLQIANDNTTEGNEPLLGIVKVGNTEVARTTITVIDTSITISYSVRTSATDGGPAVVNFKEGQQGYIVVNTQGVGAGTTLYVGYTGYPGAVEGLAETVQITSAGAGSIPFKPKIWLTGGYSVGIKIYRDAARTIEVASTTFNVPANQPSLYYSSDLAGNNHISTFNEGDTFYFQVTYPSIADGNVVELSMSIRGMDPTASNGHVWTDVDRFPVTNNGRQTTRIASKGDEQRTGDFSVWAGIVGTSLSVEAIIRDTSLPPEILVTIPETYNGLYVNAYELFKRQTSREPTSGERIRILVPTGLTLIGMPLYMGWPSTSGGTAEEVVKVTDGGPGLDISGLSATQVTVDVYGAIYGAPPGTWGILKPDPTLHGPTTPVWAIGETWTGPALPPRCGAIKTSSPFNLIIRNGGDVSGHGGYATRAQSNDGTYGSDNSQPVWSGQGGDAVSIEAIPGIPNPCQVRVRLDTGSRLTAGGGAGGRGGSWYWDMFNFSKDIFHIVEHFGGGGAPWGGRMCYWQSRLEDDAVCKDRFRYIHQTGGQLEGDIMLDYSTGGCKMGSAATSLSPGNGVVRTAYTSPTREFVSGNGGVRGGNGDPGLTYRYFKSVPVVDMDQATKTASARAGLAGNLIQSGGQIIYDNTIT